MQQLKKVSKLVHQTLIDKPETRGDDFILVLEVLKHYIPSEFNLEWCLRNHNKLGLPSFASIIRTRRKIQEKHPELENKKVQQFREEQRGEYIQYALYVD